MNKPILTLLIIIILSLAIVSVCKNNSTADNNSSGRFVIDCDASRINFYCAVFDTYTGKIVTMTNTIYPNKRYFYIPQGK